MKNVIILAIISLLIINNISAQSQINTKAQRFYKQNGKFGVLLDDGTIFTTAKYDTIFIPSFALNNEFLITKNSDKYGIVIFPSDTTPIIIEPKLNSIYDNDGLIILKQNNKYGFIAYSKKIREPYVTENFNTYLVWLKSVYISNIEYDKIKDCHLFKGNNCGFVFKGRYSFGAGSEVNNYRIIPAIYDTLIYYSYGGRIPSLAYLTYTKHERLEEIDEGLNAVRYHAIKVIKNGFVNYLTINSSISDRPMHTLFLNNTYKDEELFYAEEGIFIINQLGKPLQLYNVVDSTFKIISDEQGKALILDKYYRFRGDRWREEDPVCVFYGESSDRKNFITLFTNVNKKENSLIFKDTVKPVYEVDYHDYNRYAQVYGRYDSYYGADKQIVQKADFTAFISSVTDKVENLSIKDFLLISFPDKKVVYCTSFNSKNETIKINYPNPEKLECCCPYFQIFKFIVKDDKYNTTKKQVLGYINYKTFQFSKKKPAGCEDDKENKLSGEMYKE